MLEQCLVPPITEKTISYSLVLGQQQFITLEIKNFQRSVSIYLKIIKNISTIMPKNANKTKKPPG